jgi:hypothetical protein
MNSLFDFKRWYFLNQEWVYRNWRSMSLAVFAGVILAGLMMFWMEFNKEYIPRSFEDAQYAVFHFICFLVAIGGAFFWLYSFDEPGQRIRFFTLPVSLFERTVLAFVWLVLIPACLLLIIFPIICQWLHPWAVQHEKYLFNLESNYAYTEFVLPALFNPWKHMNQVLIVHILVLQIVLLIASLYFKNYRYIKSIGLLSLVFVGFILNTKQNWLGFSMPDGWYPRGHSWVQYYLNEFEEKHQILAPIWLVIWESATPWVVLLILWIAYYYLLNAKEI